MTIEALISMESRGPVIGEADVLRFEESLGCRLPEDYREFLLTFNGGQTSLDQVVFPIGKSTTILNSLYGINDPEGDLEKERAFPMREDTFPRDLLVIGYDGTGSRLCLAIHGVKRGEVWFNDLFDPQEPKRFLEWYEYKRDFVRVASSFTEFLKLLQPYPKV